MDVIGGLAALSQAIGIAKDIIEIGRTYDEATFKLKMSDLTPSLADAKVALSDARIELSEKAEQISTLQNELDLVLNGDFCPKCRKGRMQLIKTKGHSMHGLLHFGVEDWDFQCDDPKCGFEQKRIHDPHGAVSAQAKKR